MKIEVSNGEIVDKLTILLIKSKKIIDDSKLININKEIEELGPISDSIIPRGSSYFISLYDINEALWNVENRIRLKESNRQFDNEFIDLARRVYYLNDERAFLKKEINILSKSNLIEEKSYEQY